MRSSRFIALLIVCTLSMQIADIYAQSANANRNITSFKWIRPVFEQNIKPYSEGLAAFYEGGAWGFEDINGDIVIIPQFEEVKDFKDGLAIVKKSGKWGVINRSGKEIFPFTFDIINDFSDKIALAKSGDISFYLYSNGDKKALPSGYTFYGYSNGLARTMKKTDKGNKWGYINSKGIFIIDHIYDNASDFFGEYAVVSKNGKTFIINQKGAKFNIEGEGICLDSIKLFANSNLGYIKKNSKDYSLLVKTSKNFTIQPYSMDRVEEFSEGLALASSNGILRYIDSDGKSSLIIKEYDNAGPFSEGKAWVSSNGKYGYIDTRGVLIIDTMFSYASDFKNGYAFVVHENRKGIIRPSYRNDKFPKIVIEKLTLRDANGNGKVETDEPFNLDVTLKNIGTEAVKGIALSLKGNGEQSSWFQYEARNLSLETLEAGASATLSFNGTANTDLVSEDILVNVSASADNILMASNSSMTFPAMGINQCKPLLASYWAHTKDHSPIAAGKTNIFEITIVNDGSDIAKDVNLELRWPNGIKAASSSIKLGNISPGESRTVETTFDIDTSAHTSSFSVVATVTNFTKKNEDVKYLAFEANKMNFAVNLIGGGAVPNDFYASQMAALYASNATQEEKESAQNIQKAVEEDVLLTGLTKIKESNINRFALVIGNEDYNTQKLNTQYEPNVDFARRDAKAFAEYAENFFGIPESNIILLTDATYAHMRRNLNKVANIAKQNPGQIEIFVYYAGHGQVDGSSKDCYLIPVDVSTTAPTEGIKLEDFYSTLSNCNAKRAYVFLDACYSGVGRGITLEVKKTPVQGNLMVMTASSATQKSMPYAEKKHGMFTYFLLKSIKDAQGDISIESLFNNVKSNVERSSTWINDMQQTPELICGPGIEAGWQNWKL